MANNQWKSRTTSTTKDFLTNKKFADLDVCDLTREALADEFKYETMTSVQAMTIEPCLAGHDVLAKAKTGTGKTLAFLIPTIESAYRSYDGDDKPDGKYLSSIVISPTRELAQQIRDEADALTKSWDGDFVTEIVYGGVDIKKDRRKLDTNKPIDLLVATPGRLLDHLSSDAYGIVSKRMKPYYFGNDGNKGGNKALKSNLKFTLILDEADQLLEMGFRDSIKDIVRYLPIQRQSLLFSATIPQAIKDVGTIVLNKNYKFIDCVGDDEPTVAKVNQSYVILDDYPDMLEGFFGLLCKVLNEQAIPKIVCFFITARQTQFMAELAEKFLPKMFAEKDLPQVYEIHSRKSQGARNKANDSFREAGTGEAGSATGRASILFSSDVSARGMDYPGVTHVLQVGAPSSREQYLHRLGRTARAGESGQGILMLSAFEKKNVLQMLSDLDKLTEMKKDRSLPAPVGQPKKTGQAELDHAVYAVDQRTREQCYAAWLGYYNGMCPKRINWSKEKLVQNANRYADIVLKFHDKPPTLEKKTIGKMGLKGVPGLNIDEGKGGKGGKKGDGKGGKKGDSPKNSNESEGDGQKGRKGDGKKGKRTAYDSEDDDTQKGDGKKGKGGKGNNDEKENGDRRNENKRKGEGKNHYRQKGDGKKGKNNDDKGAKRRRLDGEKDGNGKGDKQYGYKGDRKDYNEKERDGNKGKGRGKGEGKGSQDRKGKW